jgi:predicted alpha/beta hydrolase
MCVGLAALAELGVPAAVVDVAEAHPGFEVVLTGHSLGGAMAGEQPREGWGLG